jgi:hypothetical protein
MAPKKKNPEIDVTIHLKDENEQLKLGAALRAAGKGLGPVLADSDSDEAVEPSDELWELQPDDLSLMLAVADQIDGGEGEEEDDDGEGEGESEA